MILCSGCGKKIPFNGQVCPYCHRNKGQDQTSGYILALIMIIGAGVGYLMGHAFIGAMVGGFIGAAIAARRTAVQQWEKL